MNPLQAIAKGTTTTASQVTGGVTQQIRSNLPSVSRAVYGLGLGVGPLIQNIVSQFKEDKEKKKKEEDKKEEVSKTKLSEKAIIQGFSTLSNQMKSVVTLLQDIKMINMSQLNAAQRASYEKQRAAFQAEETRLEGLQKPGVAATPIEKTSGGKKDGGILSKLMGMFTNMPFWLQLLGGALVGKSIWDMLDEGTKQQLRGAAGELADVLVQSVFKTVGDWLLNNKALAAGIALLLAPTLAARAAMGVSRFLFPAGKAATGAGAGAATGIAATGALAGMAGMEKPSPTGTPVTRPGPSGSTPLDEVGMRKSPSGLILPGTAIPGTTTAPTEPPPQKPTLGEKIKGGVRSFGGFLGKGLGILGVGTGTYNAFEEYKRDNKTSAALHGISAALSGLAMVPGPWSPFAAVGAFGTSVLASTMGGGDKPPSVPTTEGPTPAATGNESPFEGIRMGSETQAQERTGGGLTHVGMVDLAKQIQDQVSGVKEFTGFNDRYHQQDPYSSSQHKKGLALDFTVKDPNQSTQVAAEITKMLEAKGLRKDQFKVIDEYKNPSSKSTAGHIHVEMRNFKAANQLAEALGRTREQLAQASMVGPGGAGVKPSTIAPTTVATADTESAGPLAELIREAADFSRMVLMGDMGGGAGQGISMTNVNNSGDTRSQVSVPVMSLEAAMTADLGKHAAVGT